MNQSDFEIQFIMDPTPEQVRAAMLGIKNSNPAYQNSGSMTLRFKFSTLKMPSDVKRMVIGTDSLTIHTDSDSWIITKDLQGNYLWYGGVSPFEARTGIKLPTGCVGSVMLTSCVVVVAGKIVIESLRWLDFL